MGTNKLFDFLIVGAGLTGSVLARELTDAGARCLVLDRRGHVGGTASDYEVEGVRVHRHGAHVFHTNSERIWRYANRFSEWYPYELRVKARTGGKTYSFPPNLLTYQQIGISPDDPSLRQVLFDMFFRGYSMKQWGRTLEEIPTGVISRIPIRFTYDDRYFSDKHQALPLHGYSAFFLNMLEGIPLELCVDYLANRSDLDQLADRVIYTGMADSLFGYEFGRLEYRSIDFDVRVLACDSYQGSPTINYTDYTPSYTRELEWALFSQSRRGATVVSTETPRPYDGSNEPYYPVNDDQNAALYERYKAKAEVQGYILAGRLGGYRYYDMHQALGAALRLSRGILSRGILQ